MKYVYIDESGDFGLSKKSTKTVIIAASFLNSPKELSIWFKRIKRRKLDKKLRKHSEIKAAAAPKKFLDYFYQHANADLTFSVYAVIIDKNKIPLKLKREEGIVYLQSIEQLLKISQPEMDKVMFWYFDRRPIKNIGWETLRQNIRARLLLLSTNPRPLIEVHHLDSIRSLNIQFADFIAYAVFQSVENNDNRWFKIIKSHIKKIEKVKFSHL
ncbi:MAG: hypothetical protein CEN88_167 [Candidatus Berkelbacteria bacterium Licking1014_2]|uniref:DUF3800 domain-containing protein n=1 Tax=Candidatus Berkelbacteria bacterium Licking1014_2 TaxID=2017146 RepID=A0A554LW65_9BACT|nr:MAG: hypothetical protein CEN88_167 [Candidatus Berkelbacteria bacterium Licking1014_2]